MSYASAAKSRLIKNITGKKIQNNKKKKKENKTKKNPFCCFTFHCGFVVLFGFSVNVGVWTQVLSDEPWKHSLNPVPLARIALGLQEIL